jgi:hypothetical protein
LNSFFCKLLFIIQNYFDVLLDYYESITSNEILLNQIGKNLLQLLQLVNNDQTKINILNRLKQYHVALNEQIENDKFCQVDLSLVSALLFFFVNIFFLFH